MGILQFKRYFLLNKLKNKNISTITIIVFGVILGLFYYSLAV